MPVFGVIYCICDLAPCDVTIPKPNSCPYLSCSHSQTNSFTLGIVRSPLPNQLLIPFVCSGPIPKSTSHTFCVVWFHSQTNFSYLFAESGPVPKPTSHTFLHSLVPFPNQLLIPFVCSGPIPKPTSNTFCVVWFHSQTNFSYLFA